MPKKPAKPNAFYCFMLEWKKTEEKKGRRFPNGLKDVQADPKCSAAWKSLDEEAKEYYKEQAKNWKYEVKPDKRTSTGEKVEDIVRAENKEKEFIDNMREDIMTTIKKAHINDHVPQLKFYVIHINHFYMRVTDKSVVEYYPAEIAIAEFSLGKGVTRVYDKIIDSKIHVGYGNDAKIHSGNTHQIPQNACFGEKNYGVLYKEICKFLEPGRINGKLPPLYTITTIGNTKQVVSYVLDEFCNFDRNFTENFVVYSFEDLFMNLRNINIGDCSNVLMFDTVIATRMLKVDPFDFKKSICCSYHTDISAGSNYCSRSLVHRWIFVLCSYCCFLFNIDIVPGCHEPIECKNEGVANQSNVLEAFERLNLDGSVRSTGAVVSPIKHASERTYQDEQRRRSEANSPTMVLLNYNTEISNTINQPETSSNPSPRPSPIPAPEPVERPLRRPHTRPGTGSFENRDINNINLNDDNFPAIGGSVGRGARRRTQENSRKSDYASRLR